MARRRRYLHYELTGDKMVATSSVELTRRQAKRADDLMLVELCVKCSHAVALHGAGRTSPYGCWHILSSPGRAPDFCGCRAGAWWPRAARDRAVAVWNRWVGRVR